VSAVTRRRWLLLVVACAGAASGHAPLAISMASAPRHAEPSAQAVNALQTLSAPSVPGPLPGSVAFDATTYKTTASCGDAINAYLAADAPVPADSTVTQVGGSVVVEEPFARSGVMFADAPDGCQYTIAAAPTVTVESTIAALPSGQYFTRVLCGDDSAPESLSFIAEVGTADNPLVLGLTASVGSVIPGTISTLQPNVDPPLLPATVVATGSVAAGYAFDITSTDGTAHVTGHCTGSVLSLVFAG
jgi:hypothetical protein